MKLLLEKIFRYWQIRFVTVAAGALLVVYAVVMPVHSNESVSIPVEDSSSNVQAKSPLVSNLGMASDPVVADNIADKIPTAFQTPWLGENHLAAAELNRAAGSYLQGAFPRDFAEAVHRMRTAADGGNAAAQFLLGHAYQQGFGIPKDMAETSVWYARAGESRKRNMVDRESPPISAAGSSAVTDISQALDVYRKEADAGDVGAELYFGLASDFGLDMPASAVEASRWYRKAASMGSISAANNLGALYHDGDGMPRDDAEAKVWFESAASRGSAKAQYCLGRMFLQGDGVLRDDTKAAAWLTKAAQQGDAPAQILLSDMYASGRGVPGNTAVAYMWINLASATEVQVRRSRDQVEEAILPVEVAEGQKLSHEWFLQHVGVMR